MLASSIIIQIFFSIFIIFIIHYFYNYIKNIYTTNKTKDIIGFQVQKYQEIIQEIQNSKQPIFIPSEDQERMKSELLELVQSE